MRSTWAGYVEKNGSCYTVKESRCPENGGGGNGEEEDRNCDRDCIKSHLEKVGGEWGKTDR